MIPTLALVSAAYVGSGVVSYGFSLAAFQRKFNMYGMAKRDRLSDVLLSTLAIPIGPFGIVPFLLAFGTFRHGFILLPISDDEVNFGPERAT